MSRIADLDTPHLIIDEPRMGANIARMARRIRALGTRLRPHAKTAKSAPIVKAMLDPAHGGVTVSTLREAEEMADAGLTDILYAVAIAPQKLARAAALRARGVDLILTVDSLSAAQELARYGKAHGIALPAVIEIDSDGHRAGTPPLSDEACAIAHTLAREPGAAYRGLMTHAGSSYGDMTLEAQTATAARERDAVIATAGMLLNEGLDSPIVSMGSTPTAHAARDLSGITEVRVGVYLFSDLVMAGLGVGTLDDIALSVLTTVIGHQADKGLVLIDAGWMALSRDRGTQAQAIDQGYGLVCREDGTLLEDILVTSTNQEHGIVAHRHGAALDPARFPIGTRLRILPNHACATAAQHDRYAMTPDNTAVSAIVPRFNGW